MTNTNGSAISERVVYATHLINNAYLSQLNKKHITFPQGVVTFMVKKKKKEKKKKKKIKIKSYKQ